MHEDAKRLVMMLRQQSHDPDVPGRDAIPAWRTEAAQFGDADLCKAIDAQDQTLLISLWDRMTWGEVCDHCGSEDPWSRCEKGGPR